MASKITIKRSLTAAPPSGLSFGEMALVQGSGLTANQLYVGISGGSPVWVGAQIGTTGTWTDNAAQTSLATQFAIEERIGVKIAANTAGVATFNGLTGAVTGVSSFNGLTGAVGGVTTSVANTFTALQTFSAGISANGGTFGTPTQLVGTNITGTATAFTASNVTTNANLSGAVVSSGSNVTSLGTFTAAALGTALGGSTTGSDNLVFATSPVLVSPALGTPSALVGTNITGTATGFTVGSASLATNSLSLGGTAASGWAQLASPTFTGTVNTSNLIVGGNLTVSGTTTTINSTTLTIDDFNIIVGATLSGAGALGTEIATGAGIAVGTGTGISFAYEHSSTSWLSTVDLNVLSGKSYKIGGTTVLNSSALGAGITGSSLQQVGTITSGTWNGTAITDTYLAQITTADKVANSATTAVSANNINTIVLRDGSGNFTAGTITANLTGNASTATSATSATTATTATNATNIAVASDTSDATCFITFVNDSSGNQPTKVNSTLTYNAASGELSATLIDAGTF